MMTLLDAINDKYLFADWFKDRAEWSAWFAFIAALFALPMTPEQLAIYRECTGRNAPPSASLNQAWLCVGRRGGKSFILALIAVYLATFRDWRPYLQRGERATVMVIARDRLQARVIMRFIRAFLKDVPMLKRMLERELSEGFDLHNDVVIEVHTASFRSTRGYAICVALLDEIAFWPTDEESSEPDAEVLAALRPGMLQFGGAAMLLCASSPYARKGALWHAYNKHFGKDGDPILVWQAPTRVMHPSVPQAEIDAAMEEDPVKFGAEYGAVFRRDADAFVVREAVLACVDDGVFERERVSGISYRGFIDAAGGSGTDSMTLAIAHREGRRGVLDCLREVRPPFSPAAVAAEFARVLKSYGVRRARADKWGSEWVAEPFKHHGISIEPADVKSAIYVSVLALLNSKRVDLLDHPRMINQLCGLERRVARSGKDSIDHLKGQHDDLANAAAGALTSVIGSSNYVQALMEADWAGFYASLAGSYRPPEQDNADEPPPGIARFRPPSLLDHPAVAGQWPRKNQ